MLSCLADTAWSKLSIGHEDDRGRLRCLPDEANFGVRIWRICHLKWLHDFGLLISSLRQALSLQLNSGEMG